MRRFVTLAAFTIACGGKPSTELAEPPRSQLANTAEPADARVAGLVITEIEPNKGDVEGGTYARIKGNDFLADGPRSAKVYFGSRQGTIVRFASDSELIVEAPGGKVGETVDLLVVFEPGGERKLMGAFTFIEKKDTAPTIDDFKERH